MARGVVPGDRVCLVSQTRLEWVLCDIAHPAGGRRSTVPIYASNTAEQCEFIVRDAGAKIVIVEDAVAARQAGRAARQAVHGRRHLIQLTGEPPVGLTPPPVAGVPAPSRFVQSLAELRAAGRQWGVAHPGELDAHAETVDARIDVHDHLHVGDDRRSQGRGADARQPGRRRLQRDSRDADRRRCDVQYLFLPLAHVLGRELEWATIQIGCETAFSRGTAQIKEDLGRDPPDLHGGRAAHLREVLHRREGGAGAGLGPQAQDRRLGAARGRGALGGAAGRASPGGGFSYWLADKLVFSKLRARLGLDRARFLISGGAPLAAEIAEFFHGAGVLILEGYGLTETMAAAFLNTPGAVPLRHRRPGAGRRRVQDRRRRRDPDARPVGVPPVLQQPGGDRRVGRARRLVPLRRHRRQLEDGFLRITDRKKDLIVTAGGKKIAPQALENALKARSPLFSQVLVYGDKRPYCVALVTLSDDARKRFGGAEFEALAASPEVKAALQKSRSTALNKSLASYESIKKFAILPADLTEASGDLTPKLSVKRKVVIEKYRPVIETLYAAGSAAHAE